jgi:hypothetical protein
MRSRSTSFALCAAACAPCILLSGLLPAQASAVAPDGLVSWWKGEGNALDSFGANNGTLTGTPGYMAGRVGTGFVFDSNDDRVSIAHHAGLNPGASGFTVEFWMKASPAQPSGDFAIIDKSHGFVDVSGWAVQGSLDGGVGFNVAAGGGWPGAGKGGPFLRDFAWHHVACVIDTPNGRLRIHVDGVLLPGNSINPPAITNNSRSLFFGQAWGGGTPQRFFRGQLDEVTIYDRALCREEVFAIYLAGAAGKTIASPPPPPPPAVAAPGMTNWWKGEGSAADAVGTSHGAQTGTPGFATAQVGQGFVFDSNDDRVTIPHAASLNPGPGGFTVEFWIKASPTQPSGIWTVVDKSHGFVDNSGWTFQGQGGHLSFLVGAGGPPPNSNFVFGGSHEEFLLDYCWHHVAGVYDPIRERVSFYVDCRLHGEEGVLAPAQVTNNTRELVLGYAAGGGSPQRFFRGQIDELTIYDRPLTHAEIEDLCRSGASGKVQIPDTVPAVVITSPQNGAVVGSPNVTVAGTVEDVNPTTVTSIPAGISVTLPAGGGNVTGVVALTGADGVHSIALSATNVANNTAGTSVAVVLDTTPPEVTINTPLESAVLGDPLLTVNVTVADLTATSVDIHGAPTSLAAGGGTTSAQRTLTEGPNTIVVQAIDAAGNTTTVERHVVVDLSAPVVTIDSPADGTCFGPGSATIAVMATVDDLTATEVTSTPAGLSGSLPAGGGIATGTVGLVEGNNTISVDATDATARTGSSAISVVLDTTGPNVSLGAPADGAVVRGTIDVQATADDPLPGSGVAAVVFAVDGDPFATLGAAPFETMLDSTTLGDGFHTLTATATDGKGNPRVATATIRVDNTAPTIVIVEPPANALVGGTFGFRADVADSGSGVGAVTMLAGGIAPTVDASIAYGTPVASDTRNGSENSLRWLDGPLALEVRVVDAAGNQATATVTVNVDNTAPDKSLVSPVDQSVVSGVITLHAQATDPNLGQIRILVDGQLVATSPTSPLITSFDTATDLDGVMEITVDVVDTVGNRSICTARVYRANLTFDFKPESLNLRAKGNGVVTAHVEGAGLSQMLPLASHTVELRVPGGNPVRATGGGVLDDSDDDGIPDATIKFDRSALIAAVNAGIAAHMIPSAGPIPVRLVVDGTEIGTDTTRPAGN